MRSIWLIKKKNATGQSGIRHLGNYYFSSFHFLRSPQQQLLLLLLKSYHQINNIIIEIGFHIWTKTNVSHKVSIFNELEQKRRRILTTYCPHNVDNGLISRCLMWFNWFFFLYIWNNQIRRCTDTDTAWYFRFQIIIIILHLNIKTMWFCVICSKFHD